MSSAVRPYIITRTLARGYDRHTGGNMCNSDASRDITVLPLFPSVGRTLFWSRHGWSHVGGAAAGAICLCLLGLCPVEAREPHEWHGASAARRALQQLAELPEAEVRDLKYQEDDFLAIGAAWEEVLRSLPEDTELPTLRSVIDRGEIERFVGFVQGRLRFEMADRLQERLKATAAAHRKDVRFVPGTGKQARKADEDRIVTSIDVTVRRDDQTWFVSIRSRPKKAREGRDTAF